MHRNKYVSFSAGESTEGREQFDKLDCEAACRMYSPGYMLLVAWSPCRELPAEGSRMPTGKLAGIIMGVVNIHQRANITGEQPPPPHKPRNDATM